MRKNNYLWKMALALGMVLVLMPGTIGAQEEYTLEDTIVTATKTGETQLQTTSLSIAVFDQEAVDRYSAFTLSELFQYTPSVDFSRDAFGTSIYIRGIGQTFAGMAMSQNISTYVDGVFLHQARGMWADFMDIERIELLRGPQGTLFGANSTGGAVSIITKAPSDTLEMEGRFEIGNYGKRRIDAMISGPIIKDKVHGRLAVADNVRDPLITNIIPGAAGMRSENFHAFRGSLQIMPTENLEIMIRGDYRESKNIYYDAGKILTWGGPEYRNPNWEPGNPYSYENLVLALLDEGYTMEQIIPPDQFTTSNEYLRPTSWEEQYGGSLTLTWDIDEDLTLTSITALREYKDKATNYDFGENTLGNGYQFWGGCDCIDWTTQEIFLNGVTGNLTWNVGVFYLDAFNNRHPTWIPSGYGPPGGIDIAYTSALNSLAGYANVSYQLTDKIALLGGVRYTDEDKDHVVKFYSYMFDRLIIDETTYGEWTKWTPKLGIDYKYSDDVFFYATATQGFMTGNTHAFNNFIGGIPAEVPPETAWTFEGGWKTDWLDKRLRVNGSVFYSLYEDRQLMEAFATTTAMMSGPEAEVIGLELEAVARPTNRLTINAAVTWLDTELTDWNMGEVYPGSGLPDNTGGILPKTPEWAWSLGAQYVWPLEGYGYLSFGGNYSWRGDVVDTIVGDQTDPNLWLPSYGMANVRVRFETEDGHWALEGYVQNLTEPNHWGSASYHEGSPDVVIIGMTDPRTMGIRATYKY